MKIMAIRIAISLLLLLPAITDIQAELQAQTRENTSQKSKIICPQCGKENSVDALFCWNDGYPLAKPDRNKGKKADVSEPSAKINTIADKKSTGGSEQLLENLSDAELRLLFSKLSAQYGISQAFENQGRGFVTDLSEKEFVSLLRNTIRDERIIRTRVVEKQESGFGKFLKSVGAITLIIMGLGIIASN